MGVDDLRLLLLLWGHTLTQHLVSGHIDACNTERWIRIVCVFIDGEFPIVNATRKSHRTQCNTMIPSVHRHR